MHETKILVYIPAGGGGSKFLVGSASLNPTLVIPMRQEREAVEAARLHGESFPSCTQTKFRLFETMESFPVVYPNAISVV